MQFQINSSDQNEHLQHNKLPSRCEFICEQEDPALLNA